MDTCRSAVLAFKPSTPPGLGSCSAQRTTPTCERLATQNQGMSRLWTWSTCGSCGGQQVPGRPCWLCAPLLPPQGSTRARARCDHVIHGLAPPSPPSAASSWSVCMTRLMQRDPRCEPVHGVAGRLMRLCCRRGCQLAASPHGGAALKWRRSCPETRCAAPEAALPHPPAEAGAGGAQLLGRSGRACTCRHPRAMRLPWRCRDAGSAAACQGMHQKGPSPAHPTRPAH